MNLCTVLNLFKISRSFVIQMHSSQLEDICVCACFIRFYEIKPKKTEKRYRAAYAAREAPSVAGRGSGTNLSTAAVPNVHSFLALSPGRKSSLSPPLLSGTYSRCGDARDCNPPTSLALPRRSLTIPSGAVFLSSSIRQQAPPEKFTFFLYTHHSASIPTRVVDG